MKPREVKAYLNTFINYEKNLKSLSPAHFKLDRILNLLKEIGNPQVGLKIVHVAGSKGKGSTCAMAASILKESGYKVGLFTSPHINVYNERIRLLSKNQKPTKNNKLFSDAISNKEIADIFQEIKPAIERMRWDSRFGQLSFYELLTAMALYYFRKEKVDVVVLETGLGGRLDATNAVSTLICAITSISLEHTYILGENIIEIAQEKAAIIKDIGQRIVLAPQVNAVHEVFVKRCKQYGLRPLNVGEDIKVELVSSSLKSQSFKIHFNNQVYGPFSIPLLGAFQLNNAAVSFGIIFHLQRLGFSISLQDIQQGFQQVSWPGRFEINQRKSLTIFDCAHNQDSSHNLVNSIKEFFPDKKVRLILGVSNDKDKNGICKELNDVSDTVIVTRAKHPRALQFHEDELHDLFPGKECIKTRNVREALSVAFEKCNEDDIVLVTGSLFVVSEARKLCIN